jgi:hypothetical protein
MSTEQTESVSPIDEDDVEGHVIRRVSDVHSRVDTEEDDVQGHGLNKNSHL